MEKGLIFTYALTYGGAVISLFRPFYGLLIYISFSILRPESLWHWSVPKGNYSRIVAISLLLGWALKSFGDWQLKRGWGVVLALLGFWGWSVVSAAAAPVPEVAWHFVEEMAKIVLPFLVGITTITSIAQLKQLTWVILLSQGYVALELNLAYLSGFNMVQEIGFGGMDNNCVGIAMNACIGLAFFLGLSTPRWYLKGVALLSALLMAHVILFTFSRGGMFGLIVNGLVTFLLIPKRLGHYVVVIVCVLLVLRLAGPEVRERFISTFADKEKRDESADSRVRLWSNCLDCMIKHAVLGIGPHHFPQVASQYGWPHGKEAHTTWLQVAAEMGLPGVSMLAAFYAICWIRLIPFVRREEPGAVLCVRYLACMVCVSLVGFAVSAQFVTLTGLEVPYYVTLIGAGLLKITSPATEQVEMFEEVGDPWRSAWVLGQDS
jgi:probable O-glycosylation ligase (exosortase A-associated)